MKEIKMGKWTEKGFDEEGKPKEIEVQFEKVIQMCVDDSIGKELPQGIEGFKIMKRFAEAFEGAEKTGILKVEDKDYLLLKSAIEKHINPAWARKEEIWKAVEDFISYK